MMDRDTMQQSCQRLFGMTTALAAEGLSEGNLSEELEVEMDDSSQGLEQALLLQDKSEPGGAFSVASIADSRSDLDVEWQWHSSSAMAKTLRSALLTVILLYVVGFVEDQLPLRCETQTACIHILACV